MAAREVVVWDLDRVAARFEEAANTAHRLPSVKAQGYFSLWPAIKREPWESYADEEPKRFRFPPDPAAIDRMVETIGWVAWLEEEQRHLVWMRAEKCGWRDISHASVVIAPPRGGAGRRPWVWWRGV